MLGFRAVVVGWDLSTNDEFSHDGMEAVNATYKDPQDPEREMVDGQRLDLLVDAFDIGELSKQGIDSVTPSCAVLSYNLEKIEDPDLCRVHNSVTYKYFPIFDHEINRFIPSEDMQFSFPFDYTPQLSSSESCSSTQNDQYENSMERVERVLKSVAKIGDELSSIYDNHRTKVLLKLRNLSNEEMETGENLMRDILQDTMDAVKACKNINNNNDNTTSSMEALALNTMCPTYMKENYGVHIDRLTNPLYDRLKKAAKGTKALIDVFFRLDQLLQLRLQKHGWKKIEMILAASSNEEEELNLSASNNENNSEAVVPKFELGEIVTHKELGYKGSIRGWDYRPTIDCSNEWNLLEKKDNQLFYSIIPFDDSGSLNVAFTKKHVFYVAEESLIREEYSQDDVDNRVVRVGFEHFDESKQKYLATSKLRFCFESEGIFYFLCVLYMIVISVYILL